MNHNELAEFWNAAHRGWADGRPQPTELDRWQRSYNGTGKQATDPLAMAEPWIGDLAATPEAVTMGIRPGAADPRFQHHGGRWPQAIAGTRSGSYSEWAATGPYFGGDWESEHGVNAHFAHRQRFLSAWTGRDLAASEVIDFSLYPWHTAEWTTSAFDPDPEDIRRFVLEPIASTGARWAFAFGKNWWDIIESLDLPILDQLGEGGRPYPTNVDHRRWLVAEGPDGLRIAAMRLDSMPIPPTLGETELLRSVLENGPAGKNASPRMLPGMETDLSARLTDLGLSQMSIWRLWNALDDTEITIDGWHESPDGHDVTLEFGGEVVVQVHQEWADFATAQPADSVAVPSVAGRFRLPLVTEARSSARSSRKEPKPLGMCEHCFNVLNPDGSCPMECDL